MAALDADGWETFFGMSKDSLPTIPEALAERLLKADAANLVKKVQSGKPLTRAERTHLLAMAAGSEESVQASKTTAKNFVELAEALGVARKTIYQWNRRKGAPSAAPNGEHDVTAWRLFCRQRGLGPESARHDGNGSDSAEGEDMERLKARKLVVEIAEREHRLATRRGEYVETALVAERWSFHVAQALQLLRTKLENELPPIIAAMDDAATIRVEMGRVIDEVAKALHEGGGNDGA